MSRIVSVLLVIIGAASANARASDLPAECNVYGHLFCLPVTKEVHLHTYSPSEDYVLHEIISSAYSMLIYEGNAAQSLKTGPEWKKVHVGSQLYDFQFYKNGDEVQLEFYFEDNKWPKDIQIKCKNLEEYACKNQLLLMKHCSRVNDDTKCNDNFSKLLGKEAW